MAVQPAYGPVVYAGEGARVQNYLDELKKEVEKQSGKYLAPFLCIEYRIAAELSGLIMSYLAKVSTSPYQPAPKGFALILFSVPYTSLHLAGTPTLQGYVLDQELSDPLDPSKVPHIIRSS